MQESRLDVDALLAQREWLLRLARRLSNTEADADDLVQGAFAAALTGPAAAVRAPRAWLAGITRNLAGRSAVRDRARADRERAAARHEAEPSAVELASRTEAFALLANSVVQLAEPYRQTVLLRYFEGMTPKAVGERLGVPASTVRTRLTRALATLRAELRSKDSEDRWLGALAPLALAPDGARTGAFAAAAAVVVAGGLVTAWALGAPWTREGSVPEETRAASSPRAVEQDTASAPAGLDLRVDGTAREAVPVEAAAPEPPADGENREAPPLPPACTLEVVVTLDGVPRTSGEVLLDPSGPVDRGGRPDPGLSPGGATLSAAQDLDANGVATFDGLTAGGWRIAVCLDGGQGQQYLCRVPEDTGARVRLDLTSARLTGHAYDADGAPVANAWVSLSPTAGCSEGILAKTDGMGAYGITHALPSRYWISLHPGVERPTHTNDVGPMESIHFPREGEQVHDFGSPAGLGTLTLRLVTRSGEAPVLRTGLGVHLDGVESRRYHGMPLLADGGYVAEKPIEAGTWKIQTTDAVTGYGRRLLRQIDFGSDDRTIEVVLPGSRVEVELESALESLVTYVSVRSPGGRRSYWTAVRAASGQWIIDGVYPGDWELVAGNREGPLTAPVALHVLESDVTLFERLSAAE